jgi:hypothetical protein
MVAFVMRRIKQNSIQKLREREREREESNRFTNQRHGGSFSEKNQRACFSGRTEEGRNE